MYRGYVKLWRKIEDNPLSKDPYFMALWSWILILSNHQEKEWKNGYQRIPIKTGQFATSRKSLSLKTGIHESKIERMLKYLEIEQQIEQQKTTKYRLITVLNWNNYQNTEQQSEQQVNNKRTTSEQQVNTTKECIITNKNDKNVKEEEYIAEQNSAGKEISQVIEIFTKLNPTLSYGNKTQRKATSDLIEKIGFERTLTAAQYAISIISDQYSPRITTPIELKNKLGQLISYKKKNTNSIKGIVL